jgi:hypothetical protein
MTWRSHSQEQTLRCCWPSDDAVNGPQVLCHM